MSPAWLTRFAVIFLAAGLVLIFAPLPSWAHWAGCAACLGSIYCAWSWPPGRRRRPQPARSGLVVEGLTPYQGTRYTCSGCGTGFEQTGMGWLLHPEPYCAAFTDGNYHPVEVPG